jgi:hypothetical protein
MPRSSAPPLVAITKLSVQWQTLSSQLTSLKDYQLGMMRSFVNNGTS